jgi:site-specific recombinase XerD
MTSVVGTTTAREDPIAPTLESLLPSWTRSLRAAGKSRNTVSGYLDGVRCFTDFLHELGLSQVVALITREHIEMFLERQLAAHKPSTAATRFRSLRLFWRWCVEEGEVKGSPMVRMRPPAIPEAPVPVIAEEDLKKLLRVCEGAGFNARRDMAIVRLAVDTGLRRAELAGIGLEDLLVIAGSVAGGCVGLARDGMTWNCFLGQDAVDQRIVDKGLLGQPAPFPGRG